MKWFKLYTDARNDAKLRRLTRDQHFVWFNLLCYAAEQDAGGVIPETDAEVLAIEVSDGDLALLDETLEVLEKLRIIARSHPCHTPVTPLSHPVTPCHIRTRDAAFLGWAARQEKKPADTPERAKERKRKSRAKKTSGSVTPCHTLSHPVTPIDETRRDELNSVGTSRYVRDDARKTAAPAPPPPPPSPSVPSVRPDPSESSRGDHQSCIEAALDLFGDDGANLIRHDPADLAKAVSGRFDLLASALRYSHRVSSRPGGPKIENLRKFAIKIARDMASGVIPVDPASPVPRPSPSPVPSAEETARNYPVSPRYLRRAIAPQAGSGVNP